MCAATIQSRRLRRPRRNGGACSVSRSPFGQLELDATIPPVRIFGSAEINRLKLAEAGRNKVLWRYTLRDQILHNRDGACGRQIPVGSEQACNRPHVGVTVDAQNPGKVGRYFLFQLNQCYGHLIKFDEALGLDVGPARVKEYFRLQDKTVPHYPDVRTIAKDFPKFAEEIRTVALEFIDPLGQGQVKPLSKLGDAALRVLILLLCRVQCLLERGELTAQGCNL